ncbi:MAG: SpoIIE family protein phosphatase [Bacteroidaceae bacterium]|nr:SpoIIE family protein phosphatase [Bacteroidaceae bacterium]
MTDLKTAKGNWRTWLRNFVKGNAGLVVIIAAALLLELTTGVFYYAAQNVIRNSFEQQVRTEMNAVFLSIRNRLDRVEVTMDNMAWVVTDDLAHPDSLMSLTRQLLEHNPDIMGCAIACVPYYFEQKGQWYEPYSVRRADGSIESMQLGSDTHEYLNSEGYFVPIEEGCGHWCEPYVDNDGAMAKVTTYSVPVRDGQGRTAAVVAADISLDWLGEIINEYRAYKNTRCYLVTGDYNLLAGEDSPVFQTVLEELKNVSNKEGYVTLGNKESKKMNVFYNSMGGMTDWMLIHVLEDSEVFGRLRLIRLALLLPVMAGLFFVGFIVHRSSRNLERLRRVNAEKERIAGELRVASQIQQSMLPHQELSAESLELRGALFPAREVGGDLYDYFIRDEKLFFCIGDVSGKGAPSAMFMAVAHALFRSASVHENNPARIMHAINETACQGNDSNMFVTLFLGVLDLPTGHMRYCDAGHDAPIVLSEKSKEKGEELSTVNCNPNLPVGVFDDVRYDLQEMFLPPDSTLFLYTDGLTEAKNLQRRQFGLERVGKVLSTCGGKRPKEILETVTEAVREFVNGAEQSDDLTMLAIRYTPKRFETILSENITLKNDIKEVSRLSIFIKSVMERLNIGPSLGKELRLAIEEAVVNVIDYAYPAGTSGDIEVRMMSDGHAVCFQIIDTGVPFDPTAKEKADTSLSAEDRQIGGLGILLFRELMDTINYERTDGKNVLTMRKTIKG